jgi:hypothetical protein
VALLIPLGTIGGLAALGSHPAVASVGAGAKTNPNADSVQPASMWEDGGSTIRAVSTEKTVEAPSGVAALIERVFPPEVRQRALALAWCESRLVPDVIGTRNRDGTHDWGVFQLNDGGTLQHLGGTPQTALDPEWNVYAAKRLYDEKGFGPWTCRSRA